MRVRRVGPVGGDGGKDAPPSVVLLHGFTGSSASWGDAIPGGLEAPVLLVDLPGHGSGADARHLEGMDFDAVVDALAEAVARATGSDAPLDWVGYSMGGRIALALAVRHPDRVRRLVLESASPGLAEGSARTARRRRDEALARKLEKGGVRSFVDDWMSQPLFRSQATLPAEVRDEARRVRLSQDAGALATALRVMGTGVQPSFWDDLPDLHPPTLLLTGALDHKFEGLARQMAESIPRAVHRSIPGAGHTVHLEAPGRWLDTVRSFLQAQGSP
ncbi:MAG: 2-succinyl-6-hydroxy-2,4-cyclohexadiene-1-carboxylate synthase [Gemmatimonadales bacterium]|nr:MAG: 2-succinyl-6-hydroxy-2,4-cyclohexadiene-1-carboxylate synthase [Gemmatimonadales bacterium]